MKKKQAKNIKKRGGRGRGRKKNITVHHKKKATKTIGIHPEHDTRLKKQLSRLPLWSNFEHVLIRLRLVVFFIK